MSAHRNKQQNWIYQNYDVGEIYIPLLSSFIFPQFFAGISSQLNLVFVIALSIAFVSAFTAYLSLRKKYDTPFKDWEYDGKKGIWKDGQYITVQNVEET